MKPQVRLYTDGAYSPKYNVGGWAFIALGPSGNELHRESGSADGCTNNSMELEAIQRAMVFAFRNYRGANVYIVSDSKYAIQTIRSSKDYHANNPKIMGCRSIMKAHGNITLEWVKGHGIDPWNDRADKEATAVRDAAVRLAHKDAKR